MITKIGITGGIGCGKSVVSKLLRIEGIDVYDSDTHAKSLLSNDIEIRNNVIALIGKDAYTGAEPNKKIIAQKIFNDKSLLTRMNAIIHPRVWNDFIKWSNRQEKNGKNFCGFESAIIYQSGLSSKMDKIWIITAPLDIRIKRACQRDNTQIDKIKERIANQQEISDDKAEIIVNDEEHSLMEQVQQILTSYHI